MKHAMRWDPPASLVAGVAVSVVMWMGLIRLVGVAVRHLVAD